MQRMIGRCVYIAGPGGPRCPCCLNPPPGKKRRAGRRSFKRNERNQWRRSVREGE